MEGGESVLDTLFDGESVEGAQDVEMLDVEEGELLEHTAKTEVGEVCDDLSNQENQESSMSKSKRKNKKKKNKRKRGNNSGPNVTNINRFVLDVCKRLRERKSYLVWTAVGCLGVSAFSDLVKEVDAIQACGGQQTADGSRFRSGGGILWSIIKVRDPIAYQEIMRKGKEFEKQFKQQPHDKQEPRQHEDSSRSITLNSNLSNLDGLELTARDQNQLQVSTVGQKRAPVHDRTRMPVTYDDLLEEEARKAELA